MKNRGQLVLLTLILAAALLLCAGMRQKRLDRQAVLADVEQASRESSDAWHATDAAKLVIQEENQHLTEDIREAELQLSESKQKIADIEAQLVTLREEKTSLEERLNTANERRETAAAAKAAADQKIQALSEAMSALTEAIKLGDIEAKTSAEQKLLQLLETE